MEWPLTGRDSVLRRLTAALSRDGVQGIEIVGETGVGKSRLSSELLAAAAALGRKVELLAASPVTATIPYGALAHLLPPEEGNGSTTHNAHLQSLRERGDGAPLVLAVDDAHHLDEPSASLLGLAAHQGVAFIVLTRRSSLSLPGPLGELWKDGHVERIEIEPLDEASTGLLASSMLGGPVDGLGASRLWVRSGGNPLFLRELVLAALESGALVRNPAGWQLPGQLPPSHRLVELVEARIGHLDTEERRVMEALAVGGEQGVAVLDRIAEPSVVERLEERRLVSVVQAGNRHALRLGHPIYGEVVAASMPRTRVRGLMRRLADGLDSVGARRREDTMRLALWRLEGGGRSDPANLVQAAGRALAAFDAPLAERLARAAMADGRGTAACHLVLGEALAAQHRIDEADAALTEAAGLAIADGEVARTAIARANLYYFRAGKGPAAVRVLTEAAGLLGDADWIAEVESLLTLFRARAGDLFSVAEGGRRLTSRPTARPRAVVHAVVYSSIANVMLGRFAEARDQIRIAHRLSPAVRDDLPMATTMLSINDAMADAYAGNLQHALKRARHGYRTAVSAGIADLSAMWSMNLAECRMLAGDIDGALQSMQSSLTVVRERDPYSVHGIEASLASVCAAWLGRAELARELRDEVVQHDLATDVRSRIWLDRASAWTSWLEDGSAVAALRAMDAGRRALADTHLVWAAWLFHDAARLGMPEPAARRLDAIARRVQGDLVACMALQARAMATGDAVSLERAASRFEQMGAILFAAESAAMAQRAYLSGGKPKLARIAAARAALLAERCPGARTPPLADAAAMPLTPRELEIARFVADGRASREVAERLGISVRTVDNHLAAVYGKLGVAGRSELPAVFGLVRRGDGREPVSR